MHILLIKIGLNLALKRGTLIDSKRIERQSCRFYSIIQGGHNAKVFVGFLFFLFRLLCSSCATLMLKDRLQQKWLFALFLDIMFTLIINVPDVWLSRERARHAAWSICSFVQSRLICLRRLAPIAHLLISRYVFGLHAADLFLSYSSSIPNPATSLFVHYSCKRRPCILHRNVIWFWPVSI